MELSLAVHEVVRRRHACRAYQKTLLSEDVHFYRVRTPGYGQGTLVFRLFRIADLQCVDVGIAMCHFELGAREAGLGGSRCREGVQAALPMGNAEYVATWQG